MLKNNIKISGTKENAQIITGEYKMTTHNIKSAKFLLKYNIKVLQSIIEKNPKIINCRNFNCKGVNPNIQMKKAFM